MAKTQLLERIKLSPEQKRAIRTAKSVEASLTAAESVADWQAGEDLRRKYADILTQTGAGVGIRFSGSASHDFADQMEAFQRMVKIGNVPTYSRPAPAPAAPAPAAPVAE